MTRPYTSRMSRCPLLPNLSAHVLALLVAALLSGCAMVRVNSLGPQQYFAMRRGDILSTGQVSAATQATLRVAALDEGSCQSAPQACIDTIATVGGLSTDQRLASLAELSLQMALAQTPPAGTAWSDAQFDSWLKTARYAYAFLFFGQRTAGERAFEDRQTQVRDYYNYAVQELAGALFLRSAHETNTSNRDPEKQFIAAWTIHIDL